MYHTEVERKEETGEEICSAYAPNYVHWGYQSYKLYFASLLLAVSLIFIQLRSLTLALFYF